MSRIETILPDFPHTNSILLELKNLSYEQLQQAALQFVRHNSLRLKGALWLHNHKPADFYLDGDVENYRANADVHDTTHFVPFVEKIIVKSDAKIIVIGDLHGDILTLVEILYKLVVDGLLDNDYRVCKSDTYIVFVGDYINRGSFSVEVMYLLFYLQHSNIGHVFLVRGNHEYAASCLYLYKKSEESNDDVAPTETLLAELSHKFDVYYYPDILYWFDYLPLALYIGHEDIETEVTSFLQICHAGIEIGYSPELLLLSNARFEKIINLDRFQTIKKMEQLEEFKELGQSISHLNLYSNQVGLGELMNSYSHPINIDYSKRTNPFIVKNGLQWNNFLTQEDATLVTLSIKTKSLYFGKKITQYYLKTAASSKKNLVSIIRGHQHLDDFSDSVSLNALMLEQLIDQNGCVKQWDGMVYTLGDSGIKTGLQTFLIVHISGNFLQWATEHYYKKTGEDIFNVTIGTLRAV